MLMEKIVQRRHHGSSDTDTGKKIEEVESVNKVEVSIGDNSKSNVEKDDETQSTEESIEESENNKKNGLSSNQKKKLKEYLSGVYEVSEDKITIN